MGSLCTQDSYDCFERRKTKRRGRSNCNQQLKGMGQGHLNKRNKTQVIVGGCWGLGELQKNLSAEINLH